jgi:hypothetical protein
MTDKKQKKDAPFLLPAIGKPKKALTKSSIREMGKRAAKDYEEGNKNKMPMSKSKGWSKDMPDATERDWAKEQGKLFVEEFKLRKAGVKNSNPSRPMISNKNRAKLARNTGMAKGGMAKK